MARAIWSGAISFGLVNVPVKLFSATSPKAVRFHQLSGKTGSRIKQKRVDASTGDEVAFEDIVKGYELGPDRYVLIDPAELDALDPKATRTIDIEEFVDLADIDPIYYDNSYYLAPSTGGAKAYRLLLDAMRESGKVAIGRVVLRSKQQLCALRPTGDVLTLSTMLFGDEVVPPDSLDELDTVSDATGERPRAGDGAPADRVAVGGLRPRAAPRRLPGAGAGADRGEGLGPGDRGRATGERAGAGARPDGRAGGEPRRDAQRRRAGADAGQTGPSALVTEQRRRIRGQGQAIAGRPPRPSPERDR